MIIRDFVLNSETGFHARPAGMFVQKAMEFTCSVEILKEGVPYNGKSIMSILSMGAGFGSELQLKVNGEDEETAAPILHEMLVNMR